MASVAWSVHGDRGLSPVLYRIEGRKDPHVVHHDRLKICKDRFVPMWLRRKRHDVLDLDETIGYALDELENLVGPGDPVELDEGPPVDPAVPAPTQPVTGAIPVGPAVTRATQEGGPATLAPARVTEGQALDVLPFADVDDVDLLELASTEPFDASGPTVITDVESEDAGTTPGAEETLEAGVTPAGEVTPVPAPVQSPEPAPPQARTRTRTIRKPVKLDL